MNIENINNEIFKINEYLKKCLWMDFEVCQTSFIQAEIAGRKDSSINKYAISIIFEQPYFIQGPLFWSLDNDKNFINLASEQEFTEINTKYQIEEGYYLFKIIMEDFEGNAFYIAATGLKCNIYEKNPFK